jgi:GTPase
MSKKKAVMIHCTRELQDSTKYAVDEGISLLETYGAEVTHVFTFHVRKISPSTYISKGQVDTAKQWLLENGKPDFIFWNKVINNRNERVLEKTLEIPIYDRTRIILEIFRARATSSEEKLQVELAYKEFERSKITHAWSHLERQRGGTTTAGGPGEKQLELDRRMIEDKIILYKKKLKKVYTSREEQRKSRADIPLVAIVGYTNVGKTTLFNLLTHSHDLAENKLFATLAPHIHKMYIGDNKNVLISDTVGFIRDFPTSLTNAFAATLEEIKHADLIIHLRDIRMPFEEKYSKIVLDTIKKVGADHVPKWNVFNKWDIEEGIPEEEENVFYISSKTGLGIEKMKAAIKDFFKDFYFR